MPDAGESCHVSTHGSSDVVSVFGMVDAHVWCGVKLPYSSWSYHTLSKGRGRGDEPSGKETHPQGCPHLLLPNHPSALALNRSASATNARDCCMTPTPDKVMSRACPVSIPKQGTIDWTGRYTGRNGTARDGIPRASLPSKHLQVPSVRVLRAGG